MSTLEVKHFLGQQQFFVNAFQGIGEHFQMKVGLTRGAPRIWERGGQTGGVMLREARRGEANAAGGLPADFTLSEVNSEQSMGVF